jgi:chemotaxis protein histidine kinase CheA
MATLREFFEREARDALMQLERQLATLPAPDAAVMLAAARSLRGAAQMARADAVRRAAAILEAATRALVDDTLAWSADTAERTRATLDDLHTLIQQPGAADEEDRVGRVQQRWGSAGLAARQSAQSAPARSASGLFRDSAEREFRDFAAREVEAIAEALQAAVQQLADDPMDRDALINVLRRQRALLGSARLGELPVIAEILRSVDDLTRVIAKLNVGAKHEWLDVYRVANDALAATITPLRSGEDPYETNALKRLRHLRQELLDRYGTGEAVSAVHESGLVQARPLDAAEPAAAGFAGIAPFVPPGAAGSAGTESAPAARRPDAPGDEIMVLTDAQVVDEAGGAGGPAAAPAGAPHAAQDAGDVVAIDDLVYRGEAAVRRAQELRDMITAAAPDPRLADAVDELVDLVRQGAG